MSHFGHSLATDNEARNGHGGLYKANNKGKIAPTAAVRGSAVIIEPISSADCLILSPASNTLKLRLNLLETNEANFNIQERDILSFFFF